MNDKEFWKVLKELNKPKNIYDYLFDYLTFSIPVSDNEKRHSKKESVFFNAHVKIILTIMKVELPYSYEVFELKKLYKFKFVLDEYISLRTHGPKNKHGEVLHTFEL